MTWNELLASDLLQPVDRHLGALAHRLAGGAGGPGATEEADVLAVSAALLSAVARRGDACVDLAELAETPFPAEAEEGPALPALADWRAHLEASALVGTGDEGDAPTPFVLDDHGRLYLHRYHRAETRLAAILRARAGRAPRPVDPTALLELFPAAAGNAVGTAGGRADGQALAAFVAARGDLAVITGGPGTGKTWTVARLIALLRRQEPELRIHCVAPTGKAAARLGESLAGQLDGLGVDPGSLPEARTLHRLLRYQPGRDRFGHGPDRPLPTDMVILDEASMVDLLLMEALFAALPDTARVVLLGDPDQLASVATGYVLGALWHSAAPDHFSPELAAAWADASGSRDGLEIVAEPGPLDDVLVHLRESRRFRADSALGRLAADVRGTGVEWTTRALADPDARRVDHGPVTELDVVAAHLDAWADALRDAEPDRALALLQRFQILCAQRRGTYGVEGVCVAVEAALRERGWDTTSPLYRGRPVLVTANDHGSRLFNGDIGVCWRGDQGAFVAFPAPDQAVGWRAVLPGRLPAHDTAWALTVHKSQGSEYDRVLLVLPEETGPLCTRELLYTGVTRARTGVTLMTDPKVLRYAASQRIARASGLADHIRDRD